MYSFDRTPPRWCQWQWWQQQFRQVSPFIVHLVLDTSNIWHVMIESASGGSCPPIRPQTTSSSIDFDPFVVNFMLEVIKSRSFVIGQYDSLQSTHTNSRKTMMIVQQYKNNFATHLLFRVTRSGHYLVNWHLACFEAGIYHRYNLVTLQLQFLDNQTDLEWMHDFDALSINFGTHCRNIRHGSIDWRLDPSWLFRCQNLKTYKYLFKNWFFMYTALKNMCITFLGDLMKTFSSMVTAQLSLATETWKSLDSGY